MNHVLILERLTSIQGRDIILKKAKEVLSTKFPELAKKIELYLPNEKSCSVEQLITAVLVLFIKK